MSAPCGHCAKQGEHVSKVSLARYAQRDQLSSLPGLSLYVHFSLICFAKFNFNWVSRNTLSKVEILVLQVFES